MSIVTIDDVARLWGRLTSLKLDAELLREDGNNPDVVRERQIQSAQLSYELREAYNRILRIRKAYGRQSS